MFTRAHQVRKYAYRVRQNVFNQQGCLWDIFICPIQAGPEPDIFIWGATGGVSFGTRGAVNGLCRTFRKRPENFWGGHWGGQAKFWGAVAPPGTPLTPPLHSGLWSRSRSRGVGRIFNLRSRSRKCLAPPLPEWDR